MQEITNVSTHLYLIKAAPGYKTISGRFCSNGRKNLITVIKIRPALWSCNKSFVSEAVVRDCFGPLKLDVAFPTSLHHCDKLALLNSKVFCQYLKCCSLKHIIRLKFWKKIQNRDESIFCQVLKFLQLNHE